MTTKLCRVTWGRANIRWSIHQCAQGAGGAPGPLGVLLGMALGGLNAIQLSRLDDKANVLIQQNQSILDRLQQIQTQTTRIEDRLLYEEFILRPLARIDGQFRRGELTVEALVETADDFTEGIVRLGIPQHTTNALYELAARQRVKTTAGLEHYAAQLHLAEVLRASQENVRELALSRASIQVIKNARTTLESLQQGMAVARGAKPMGIQDTSHVAAALLSRTPALAELVRLEGSTRALATATLQLPQPVRAELMFAEADGTDEPKE